VSGTSTSPGTGTGAPTRPAVAEPRRSVLEVWGRPSLGPALVALTVLVFTLLNPGTFFTRSNLIDNVLLSGAALLIVASAQTIVMVVGDFDLSVGATASLAMVISAKMLADSDAPVGIAVATGLAVGLAAGLLNGLLVSYAGVNAFIATLGTLTLFNGLGLYRTNAQPVYDLPDSFVAIGQGQTLGIGNPVWLAGLVALLTWFLLDHTPLGRRFYAIGGNADAARYAGIDVRRTRLLAFLLAGLISAVAGIITASYLETADPSGPLNLMLPSIAAVFLGTAMLRDGRANLPGTLLGFLLWTVLASGLNQLGINTYLQTAAQGAILVLAVLPPALSRLRHR
jgi:ribose transport system permease protein